MQTRFWCGKEKDKDILRDLCIDGTSLDLREMGRGWGGDGVEWIILAQDRDSRMLL